MQLRPQDVLVLLKLASQGEPFSTYADLAEALGLGVGEVHRSLKRSAAARLYNEQSRRPMMRNLREFVVHGVPYAFPAHPGAPTRGLPTAHAAAPLEGMIAGSPDSVAGTPVWPHADGTVRGNAIEPLYPCAPDAALRDPQLYELLALVDALRIGRARERSLAAAELNRRLDA
jgi:hypothetical protein